MNEKLPSREQTLELLESICSGKVVDHCKAVADLALETAEILMEKGLKIDCDLVEIGALLHDIGRSKTHKVNHALVGSEIAKAADLPDSVVSIIKRHVGGGITTNEAERLGWPKDVYIPNTLEEKIVSYADKLIENAKYTSIETIVEKLKREFKHEAAARVLALYKEIRSLMGDY